MAELSGHQLGEPAESGPLARLEWDYGMATGRPAPPPPRRGPGSMPLVERAWRTRVTRRCLREVARLHAAGTEVTVLGPGPDDLAAIGRT